MLTLGLEAYSDRPFPFALLKHDGLNQAPLPDWKQVAGYYKEKPGKNQRINIHAAQMLMTDCVNRQWAKVAYQMTSHDAWKHAYLPVFKESIQKLYPRLEERMGRRIDDWTVGRRLIDKNCNVYLDFQLSYNTPTEDTESTVSKPHIDNPVELVAGLLYLREEGDDAGGELQVFACPNPKFEGKADLRQDVEKSLLFTVPYGDKNGIMFLQTPFSVHGVTPRKPTNKARRFISFSAELGFPLFEIPR